MTKNDLRILKELRDYGVYSLEYLEEGIRANEYTFTDDGKRFG